MFKWMLWLIAILLVLVLGIGVYMIMDGDDENLGGGIVVNENLLDGDNDGLIEEAIVDDVGDRVDEIDLGEVI